MLAASTRSRASRSLNFLVLTVLALVAHLQPALALSNACSAVNVPFTTAEAGQGAFDTQPYDGSLFDSGEEFVFTVTTQYSVADEMDPANDDHTNSAVGYWSSDIADDGDQYRPTVGAEVNETVIIPINVTTSYYFGIQGSQMPGGVSQGEASMTLICRASSNTPSSDATLSALTLSSGTLSPSFASGTITYTASVGNGASSLTLTPTTNSGGTVTINGNAAASGQGFPVSLSVGDNMLSIVVTAADGTTTKTYTLTVTRAAAAPVVSSLSPSTGSTSGGTAVTIAGTDFTGATNVTIGGQAATNVSVVSATQITATTPAHIAGAVDVVVTTPGGSGTLTNGFTYSTSTPTVVVTASNANPSLGDTVTLTATLSNGSSPSGTVTFKDNGATLGTGTISGTTASYSTSGLSTGSHSITAEYAGDTNNAAATSSSITVSVGQSTNSRGDGLQRQSVARRHGDVDGHAVQWVFAIGNGDVQG